MCFLGVHTRKVGNSCSTVECTISIGEMSAAVCVSVCRLLQLLKDQ